MSNLNSSGSRERFTLASGESKTFHTALGGNECTIQVQADDQAAASVSVKLQTSEDGTSFSDVGSAVTVVPRGRAVLTGKVGKYCKILSSAGLDVVHVAAELRQEAQIVPAL